MRARFHQLIRTLRTSAPRRRLSGTSSEAASRDRATRAESREGTGPTLAVLLPAAHREFAARLEAASSRFVAIEPSQAIPAEATHFYAPQSLESMLGVNQLCNVLLCLSHEPLDFVIVSTGFEEAPAIRIAGLKENLVLSRGAHGSLSREGLLPTGARGRVLRLLPASQERWHIDLAHPDELGVGSMLCRDAELLVDSGAVLRGVETQRATEDSALFQNGDDSRPTILVLSIFMVVGGAERVLIEVMKQLEKSHRFVVITTEPVSAERGSLNHQALEQCDLLFDLGELARQSEHLALLERIVGATRPSLLFICNGSPWLLDNAGRLRDMFESIPIVDQQVYDAKEGWIQSYGDAAIQSFDRFIAINARIHEVFVKRLAMDPDRIDLIYPAVDDARFNPESARSDGGADDFGIEAKAQGAPIFALVGRLTDQKRPLSYLELARRAKSSGLRDHFLLIGDGELASHCDAFIADHRLDNVTRIPFAEDLSRVLPRLSGLIITSSYEGLPVAMLEALCMGVPVLSTDVGDVRLVLEEYGSGRIAGDEAGVDSLFEAFRDWRSDLPELAENARRAAPQIAERFSAAAVARRYASSWERALRDGGGALPLAGEEC